MAVVDSENAQKALMRKLGCNEHPEGDHIRYVLRDETGTILSSTYISHGSRHDIRDGLISKMAKQLRLGTSANFVGMVNCSKSKEECIEIIKALSI